MQETSVIIPSYNGLEKLKSTLSSILSQSVLPKEYILVLDGCTDGTRNWLQQQNLPDNFLIITQPNCGRAAARNAGVRLATGDILIFIDDDIRLPTNLFERHFQLQLLYPFSLISGDVIQDLTNSQCTDFHKFRRWQETRWNHSINSAKIFKGFHFTTANLSISRQLMLDLGCFDERLSDGEDLLFGYKAVERGISIYFDSSLVSFHCDYSGLGQYINRCVEYSLSKRNIFVLYPQFKSKYDHFSMLPSSSWYKSFARNFFVFNNTWKFLIASWYLMILPLRIRFMIYDLIISSSVYALLADRIGTANLREDLP